MLQWRGAVCFLLGMQVTHIHTRDTNTHMKSDACYVNALKASEFSCAWLNIK